jgi:acyl-coenzyme A synthetase/AMP-(fatty) acid ligase
VILSARRPTPRSVLALMRRHGVTTLAAVPTFWAQLATFLDRHPDPAALGSLRLAISAGENLPASVAQRVRGAIGVDLLEGLGCSECSTMIFCTRPGEPQWGTLGRPTPEVEVRLADDDGHPTAPGEPGRVWVRCEGNTSGYWRNAAETRELIYGPWLRLRDVVREDDGHFRYVGRVDELFKVGGRWVSPAEVEAALHEHPHVAEAAVVGQADHRCLIRPIAFVVLASGRRERDGLAEELRRHVAHRLEPFKAPASVTVLKELPKLPSGKIDRLRLRSMPTAARPAADSG